MAIADWRQTRLDSSAEYRTLPPRGRQSTYKKLVDGLLCGTPARAYQTLLGNFDGDQGIDTRFWVESGKAEVVDQVVPQYRTVGERC